MNTTRILLFAMLLVQAAAEGMLAGRWYFPAAAAVAALAALLRPIPFRPTRRQTIYSYFALAIVFGLKWRLMPLDIGGRYSAFPDDYALTHCIAQGLLVAQIVHLAINRFEYADGSAFAARYFLPALGAAQLACITDFVARNDVQKASGLVCAGIFAVLYSLYALQCATSVPHGKSHYGYYAISLTPIFLAVACGGAAAWYLDDNASKVDIFFYRLLRPGIAPNQAGFSNRATLDSVSFMHGGDAENIALRIKSDTPPGYLRGAAYDLFDGGQWQTAREEKMLAPKPSPPELSPLATKEIAIPIRQRGHTAPGVFSIWPVLNLRGPAFNTLQTAWIATPASGLLVDEHLCCHCKDLPRGRAYRILETGTPPPTPLSEDMRRRYLQVPIALTPEARAAAIEALRDARTVSEKIQKTTDFFRNNFKYQMGIQVPEDADPLSYFLTKRPPAHCEFFAAGAAMLLRLAEVPCRYVTGFVTSEKNLSGGYWVARNRDAHAWVEAWDPERGWITVEATPGGGVPHASNGNIIAASWDALRFRLSQWWTLLREEGMAGVAKLLQQLLGLLVGTVPGQATIVAVTSIVAVRLSARFPRRHPPHSSREFETFHRLLAQMDKLARKRGFIRAPHETLHQYAARIAGAQAEDSWNQTVANWYRVYAEARFNGGKVPELPQNE